MDVHGSMFFTGLAYLGYWAQPAAPASKQDLRRLGWKQPRMGYKMQLLQYTSGHMVGKSVITYWFLPLICWYAKDWCIVSLWNFWASLASRICSWNRELPVHWQAKLLWRCEVFGDSSISNQRDDRVWKDFARHVSWITLEVRCFNIFMIAWYLKILHSPKSTWSI